MKSIPVRSIQSKTSEPEFFGNFEIRDLAEMTQGQAMHQALHRHDFYFLLVIEKAAGMHMIDFVAFPIREYVIYVMRPGQVHELSIEAGASGFMIQFDKDFFIKEKHRFGQLLRQVSAINYCEFQEDDFAKIIPHLKQIQQEQQHQNQYYLDAISAQMNLLFIWLLRSRQCNRFSENEQQNYQQEQFEKFVELLEQNIKQQKQVSDYAEALSLSAYQLNAITKSFRAKTTSQMINEQIILEAKRQLLATNTQVKEIAYDLGYEDVSYFGRFFKKQTGHSPESFRQNFA